MLVTKEKKNVDTSFLYAQPKTDVFIGGKTSSKRRN
jgi:hypothetical protein